LRSASRLLTTLLRPATLLSTTGLRLALLSLSAPGSGALLAFRLIPRLRPGAFAPTCLGCLSTTFAPSGLRVGSCATF